METMTATLYFAKYNYEIDKLCRKLKLSTYFKKIVTPLIANSNEKFVNDTFTISDARLVNNTAKDVVGTILELGDKVHIKSENIYKEAWVVMNDIYNKNEPEYIEYLRFLDVVNTSEVLYDIEMTKKLLNKKAKELNIL